MTISLRIFLLFLAAFFGFAPATAQADHFQGTELTCNIQVTNAPCAEGINGFGSQFGPADLVLRFENGNTRSYEATGDLECTVDGVTYVFVDVLVDLTQGTGGGNDIIFVEGISETAPFSSCAWTMEGPGTIPDHHHGVFSTSLDDYTITQCAITCPGGGGGFGELTSLAPSGPLDSDGDGVADVDDNCIDVHNPGQEDDDSDGWGNVCDNCPDVSNPDQDDSDGDGTGDACEEGDNDADDDGVPDAQDNCPDTPNSSQDDEDSDGLGDFCDNCALTSNAGQENSDGDYFGNACDNCPHVYNRNQADYDEDGTGDACDATDGSQVRVHNIGPGPVDFGALNQFVENCAGSGPGVINRVVIDRPVLVFTQPFQDTNAALPPIDCRLEIQGDPVVFPSLERASNAPVFRFADVGEQGSLGVRDVELLNFGASTDGGTIHAAPPLIPMLPSVRDLLDLQRVRIRKSSAGGSGGAISSGRSLHVRDSDFTDNAASDSGGAIAAVSLPFDGVEIVGSRFSGNQAQEGSDISLSMFELDPVHGILSSTGLPIPTVAGNSISAADDLSVFQLDPINGTISLTGNSVSLSPGGFMLNVVDPPGPGNGEPPATAIMNEMEQTLVPAQRVNRAGSGESAPRLQDICQGGGGLLHSLGYNAASDTSCDLDHPTDLEGVDLMLSEPDEDGIKTPLPGSPLIDHGPAEMITFEGDDWPSLPCGYKDIYGLGRPQDGDGDGSYECDVGAVEVQGEGEIVPGHSAAYYASDRVGEGQYVEILAGGKAVIYTFTYRPDGSGPAWFIAVADQIGNSLVSDEVLRPVGTSFGDNFDPGDIWYSPWGGMSMVFSDCTASAQPGRIALSGSPGLGYMPLLTSATRLTHIAGCGLGTVPSPMAGLSGSFFALDRAGEGVIVEWLPDGTVLAILFTYDLEGNQMWIFGTGEPDGTTVTIDALYPTGFATWGDAFDGGDVVLESWGTFTLDYTDCDHLGFSWASTVNGYGSGQRDYMRLSNLAGLECPEF